jgi:hypothetical protein
MSIKKMVEAKAKAVPKTGFNVVGVDSFSRPGEELYIVGHYDTLEEAEAELKVRLAESDDPHYIYTSKTK